MLEYIYFCFGLNNLLNQEEKTIEIQVCTGLFGVLGIYNQVMLVWTF